MSKKTHRASKTITEVGFWTLEGNRGGISSKSTRGTKIKGDSSCFGKMGRVGKGGAIILKNQIFPLDHSNLVL